MILSLCVNDGSDGHFTGNIEAIQIEGSRFFTSKTDYWLGTLVPLKKLNCDWRVKTKHIVINNLPIPYLKNRTSPATWCYEDFIINRAHMALLLRYIKTHKLCELEDTIPAFEKVWNKKIPILAIDLRELEVKT